MTMKSGKGTLALALLAATCGTASAAIPTVSFAVNGAGASGGSASALVALGNPARAGGAASVVTSRCSDFCSRTRRCASCARLASEAERPAWSQTSGPLGRASRSGRASGRDRRAARR